jgi:hypothetical protein
VSCALPALPSFAPAIPGVAFPTPPTLPSAGGIALPDLPGIPTLPPFVPAIPGVAFPTPPTLPTLPSIFCPLD